MDEEFSDPTLCVEMKQEPEMVLLDNNFPLWQEVYDDIMFKETEEVNQIILTPDEDALCSFLDEEMNDDDTDMSQLSERQLNFKLYQEFTIRLCAFCGLELDTKLAWIAHMNGEHNFEQVSNASFTLCEDDLLTQCNICGMNTPNRKKAQKEHFLTHQQYVDFFKCRLCTDTNYANMMGLRNHLKEKHANEIEERRCAISRSFKCIYCGKLILKWSEMCVHYMEVHKEADDQKIMYVCPSCGAEFIDEQQWQMHCIQAHGLNKPSNIFMEESREENRRHMVYSCTKCPTVYRQKEKIVLLYHASSHMPHLMFKCRYCSATFQRSKEIRGHICAQLKEFIHRKLPPLNNENSSNIISICPACGEEFEDHNLWKIHITSVHELDKLENQFMLAIPDENDPTQTTYKCSICDKLFDSTTLSQNLQVHSYTHMQYGLKQCKVCKYTCKSLSISNRCYCNRQQKLKPLYSLRIKANPHSEFVCTKCGGAFKRAGFLNQHIASVHNLRTPQDLNIEELKDHPSGCSYRCLKCAHLFNGLSFVSMYLHAAGHDDLKTFRCTRCQMSSPHRKFLTHHNCEIDTSVHWKFLRKYMRGTCPSCGEPFSTREGFKKHVLDNHRNFVELEDLQIVKVKGLLSGCQHKCLVCDHIFERDAINLLQQHAFQHMPYKMYNCALCEFGGNNKSDIIAHLRKEHDVFHNVTSDNTFDELIQYHCPACDDKMSTYVAYTKHIYGRHQMDTLEGLRVKKVSAKPGSPTSGDRYECLDCGEDVGSTSGQHMTHRVTHMPYKPFRCIKCRKPFKKKRGVRVHVLKCKQKKATKVPREIKKKKNKQPSKPKAAVNKDATPESNVDPLQARSCADVSKARIFINAQNELTEHVTYACPACNEPLETQDDWHSHISLNHDFFDEDKMNVVLDPDGKFRCTECNVTVCKSIGHQQRHKLTHMPFKSFICRLCAHRAYTIFVLFGHLQRRHFNPGAYKCVMCDEVFETNYKLALHGRTAHTPDEYPDNFCTICMHHYHSSHALRTHMDVHEYNRKMYNCLACGRSYKSQSERRKHLIDKHTDAVPDFSMDFVHCLICLQWYKDRLELEEHIKTHAGEEVVLDPLTCKLCHYTVTTASGFSAHMRNKHSIPGSSSPVQKHSCNYCNKEYLNAHTLKKHYKREHADFEIPKFLPKAKGSKTKKGQQKRPANATKRRRLLELSSPSTTEWSTDTEDNEDSAIAPQTSGRTRPRRTAAAPKFYTPIHEVKKRQSRKEPKHMLAEDDDSDYILPVAAYSESLEDVQVKMEATDTEYEPGQWDIDHLTSIVKCELSDEILNQD